MECADSSALFSLQKSGDKSPHSKNHARQCTLPPPFDSTSH